MIEKTPAVSVITATWNSGRTLRIALSSLIAQTFEDWESWVIGDGCTDDTESVVRSFADRRLQFVNLPRNHGSQAFPNNEGLRRARGRFVAYLGHDDIWLPGHLKKLTDCIESTGADLVHALCGDYGQDKLEVVFGPPHPARGYDRIFVPPSAWLHCRSLRESIGFWNDPDRIAVQVDYEYLRRIVRAGKKIVACPCLTVVKIPSGKIGLYSGTGELPQLEYWQRIQADAAGMEWQTLTDAAVKLSEFSVTNVTTRMLARQLVTNLRGTIRAATESWPLLSRFYWWRQQNLRRKTRSRRGLN